MSIAVVACETGTFTAAGTNTDILSIAPADDKPVALCRLFLSQGSEVGDAMEEGIRVTVKRLNTFSVGSGGATIDSVETPDSSGGNPGATVRANDTTPATGASTDILWDCYWNVRAPLELVWADERFRPVVKGAEGLVVVLETTPADDITISMTAEYLEG